MYSLVIGIIRISILLLIRRLFCDNSPKLRRVVNIVMATCVAFYVAADVTLITQCVPTIATFSVRARIHGHCPNLEVKFFVLSGLHIGLDLIVLALPVRSIWGLNRPVKDRLKIMVLFWASAFVCVCASLRMMFFSTILRTIDISCEFYLRLCHLIPF